MGHEQKPALLEYFGAAAALIDRPPRNPAPRSSPASRRHFAEARACGRSCDQEGELGDGRVPNCEKFVVSSAGARNGKKEANQASMLLSSQRNQRGDRGN